MGRSKATLVPPIAQSKQSNFFRGSNRLFTVSGTPRYSAQNWQQSQRLLWKKCGGGESKLGVRRGDEGELADQMQGDGDGKSKSKQAGRKAHARADGGGLLAFAGGG